MSFEDVPLKWIDTLENDKMVRKWTQKTDDVMPVDSPNNIISYIKRHFGSDLNRIIVSESSIPQSFVHWWSRMFFDRLEGFTTAQYPCILKWIKDIKRDHPTFYKSDTISEVGVISVLTTWMDILYTDMILYEDENTRSNVPRLYCGKILCKHREKPMSRAQTLQFIMEEGHKIFEERGFNEGIEYWKALCNKYKI